MKKTDSRLSRTVPANAARGVRWHAATLRAAIDVLARLRFRDCRDEGADVALALEMARRKKAAR